MFRKIIFRILVSAGFALPLAFAFTAAGMAAPVDPQTPQDECVDCHEIIRGHWAESGHANAFDDPIFQQDWAAQGKPEACLACHTTGFDAEAGTWEAEGVACTTCHYPTPANHPEKIMPTDVSSRLCGDCHLDTYTEWTDSVHAQEDLACVRCHNPHTASLKTDDAQELCSSCHSEEVHFFGYTIHAQEGLLCTDCHLTVAESTPGEGHGQRTHTFTVSLEACAACHEEEMHYPVSDSASAGEAPVTTMGLLPGPDALLGEPVPVSPAGFAVLAALLGTAFGMVLSPWIERWFLRLKS